jgi:hypothetical protein
MTNFRIQALEDTGFEWKPSISRGEWKPKRAGEAPEHVQTIALKKTSAAEKSVAIKSTSLSYPKNPTAMAMFTSATSRVESNKFRDLEAGDARFDATDLDVCGVFFLGPAGGVGGSDFHGWTSCIAQRKVAYHTLIQSKWSSNL